LKTSVPFDGTFGAPLAKSWQMRFTASNTVAIQRPNLGTRKFGQCPEHAKGHPRQRVPFQGRGNSSPSPFVMSVSIVASRPGDAQHSCNSTAAYVLERSRTLETIPEIWRDALLAFDSNKRPVCPVTGRLLNDWPRATAPSFNQLLRAQAVGLRTGPISSTIAFDFDGIKSWKTFRRLFGGQPWHVLPDSLQWTSGRDARRQVAFFVAPEHHHLLETKRRKIDDLEFRWENAASVICGKHPLTAGYKWLEGYAPWEQKLATLPLELIEKIPNCREAPERADNKLHGLMFTIWWFRSINSLHTLQAY
jgi:hypothetical protein